jgi:putative phage-type endonuclease
VNAPDQHLFDDVEQRSAEWYALRLGIPTASGMANVMAQPRAAFEDEAATRRQYRVAKALEKLTGRSHEDKFTSRYTALGIEREPMAREAYNMVSGHEVTEVGFVRATHLDVGASPDGLVGTKGGVEIKCPSLAVHWEYVQRTTVPPEYHWQVHTNILCTGADWWDFVTFNPDFEDGLDLHIIRVHRDEGELLKLEQGITRFNHDVRNTVEQMQALKSQRLDAMGGAA